jgi:hypothetical protein
MGKESTKYFRQASRVLDVFSLAHKIRQQAKSPLLHSLIPATGDFECLFSTVVDCGGSSIRLESVLL